MDVFVQLTATGLVNGMIYALVAFGFIAIFRVTNVVNFAQGEFLMFGAFIFLELHQRGVPIVLAMAGAVAATGFLGATTHRIVIQPAGRGASIEALVIITIGMATLLRGAAQLLWGSDPVPVPPFTAGPPVEFFGASIARQALWVIGLGVATSVVLWLFFTRTTRGLGLRACADSRAGADIVGIDSWRMGRTAFALGCALAGLAGVTLSPLSFVSFNLGVMLSFKGFTVAILGGLRSFPAAMVGGLALGLVESYTAGYGPSSYRDATTFIILLLVLLVRPGGFTRGPKVTHVQMGGTMILDGVATAARGLRRAGHVRSVIVAGVVMLVIPLLLRSSTVSSFIFAGHFALVALGVVLLLGFTGQISLAHASQMGIGGYTTAILMTRTDLPPLMAVIAGAALSCAVAWPLSWIVFRFEGFYLAVVTLGFAVIFTITISQPNDLTNGSNGIVGVRSFSLFGVDITSTRGNFYLAWTSVLLAVVLAIRLIDSRFGRAMKAIKGSERAAVASGVDPAKIKRTVFIIASGLAAIAGSLYVHYASIADPGSFDLFRAVEIVAMVVVGGMFSVWGAVVGAVFMTVIPQLVEQLVTGPRAGQIEQVIFGLLLMVVMVARPDGLVGLLAHYRSIRGYLARRRSDLRITKQVGVVAAVPSTTPAPVDNGLTTQPAQTETSYRGVADIAGADRQPLLVVTGLSKSFGGLRALKHLDLIVPAGSITALIGPNGAGKTTAFNCIVGADRPDAGSVTLSGQRIDNLLPHDVVRNGLSRTFQNVQLFGNMSALENVMVGCHSWTRTGPGGAILHLGRQRREEAEIEATAWRWIEYVGLADVALRPARTLPFGHQRLLELARSLAANPRLLLLDEPAAGLNRIEKNHLGDLIRDIHGLGTTVLLVEHDMTLVMNLAETVVVLEEGIVIAHGPPARVRNDSAVRHAYLGISA